MRLLNRLFVMLFVRRDAQAHARAVLDEKARNRTKQSARKPAAKAKPTKSATPAKVPAAEPAAMPEPASAPATAETDTDTSVLAGRPVEPGSERAALIQAALTARKAREAEWDALSPAQKSRAIAGLGESMAALVETFGKSDRAA